MLDLELGDRVHRFHQRTLSRTEPRFDQGVLALGQRLGHLFDHLVELHERCLGSVEVSVGQRLAHGLQRIGRLARLPRLPIHELAGDVEHRLAELLAEGFHAAVRTIERGHEGSLELRCLAAPELSDERCDFASKLLHLARDLCGIVEPRLTDQVRNDETVLFELANDGAVESLAGRAQLSAFVCRLFPLVETLQTLAHVEQQRHGPRAAVIADVGELVSHPPIGL